MRFWKVIELGVCCKPLHAESSQDVADVNNLDEKPHLNILFSLEGAGSIALMAATVL
jgi:hypothetical protein